MHETPSLEPFPVTATLRWAFLYTVNQSVVTSITLVFETDHLFFASETQRTSWRALRKLNFLNNYI